MIKKTVKGYVRPAVLAMCSVLSAGVLGGCDRNTALEGDVPNPNPVGEESEENTEQITTEEIVTETESQTESVSCESATDETETLMVNGDVWVPPVEETYEKYTELMGDVPVIRYDELVETKVADENIKYEIKSYEQDKLVVTMTNLSDKEYVYGAEWQLCIKAEDGYHRCNTDFGDPMVFDEMAYILDAGKSIDLVMDLEPYSERLPGSYIVVKRGKVIAEFISE